MRIILWIATFCSALTGWAQEVDLAADIWPPFTNRPGEKALAMSLVNEALARSGIKATTDIHPFEEVLSALQTGNVDGSPALWKTPDREEYLIYSIPYLENRLVLAGRKGSTVDYTSLDQLAGKKVAIVEGYAYGDAIDTLDNVGLVAGKNDQHNLDRLLAGEVDYILVDDLLANYLRQYQPEDVGTYLEIGTQVMFRRTLHFAVSRKLPGAMGIVDGFNKEIQAMAADGTYNRILELNWIRADVDGDGNFELVLDGEMAGKNAPSSSYDVMFGASGPSGQPGESYFIGGKEYASWKDVPEKYKVTPASSSDWNSAGFGVRLKF